MLAVIIGDTHGPPREQQIFEHPACLANASKRDEILEVEGAPKAGRYRRIKHGAGCDLTEAKGVQTRTWCPPDSRSQ